jgi:hypothetical protein
MYMMILLLSPVQMQDSANELLELWKESEQSTQRLLKVYQIFEIISAHSSDEINEEKYLSAALLRKIEKQIQTIKAANLTLLRDKYQRKRRKLMELLKELHFTTSDVGFDPKEKCMYSYLPSLVYIIILRDFYVFRCFTL